MNKQTEISLEGKNDYEFLYEFAKEKPLEYWNWVAKKYVHWFKPFEKVIDYPDPVNEPQNYRWFKGGQLNTCYNALDYHIEHGLGEKTALIYDSPVTDTIKTFTYNELLDQVQKFAGVLYSQGVKKGDVIIIYMPNIPQATIAMLACARIGAVHSVVFGGFAPHELATRIDDSKAKIVITASCGFLGMKKNPANILPYKPLVDQAINISKHKPTNCIVFQRDEVKANLIVGRDLDWTELMENSIPFKACVHLNSDDPLYILYTSGTTGKPKGIVRDNGGYNVMLKWSMDNFYKVDQDAVFWAGSDVGWVVGHSYIVYGPLLHGCTTLMYEGKPIGTPDAGAFWRVIAQHKVQVFFTAPTAFRAIRGEDFEAKYIKEHDLSKLKYLFLAGERCDVDTLKWAEKVLKIPVIDHYWQTETGAPVSGMITGNTVAYGSSNKPVPGHLVELFDNLDEHGSRSHEEQVDTKNYVPVETGKTGNIFIKLPLPPGSLLTLWKNEEGYKKAYLNDINGYYKTGDAGYIDSKRNLFVMSRIDDVINVSAHRLSTSEMESVLFQHEDVAECAVVGVSDTLRGQVPIGLVVLKKNSINDINNQENNNRIIKDLIHMVRSEIGAIAYFKKVVIVKRLPKTRSGKILRGTIRKMANTQDYTMPPTIEDPAVITEMKQALEYLGFNVKPVLE